MIEPGTHLCRGKVGAILACHAAPDFLNLIVTEAVVTVMSGKIQDRAGSTFLFVL